MFMTKHTEVIYCVRTNPIKFNGKMIVDYPTTHRYSSSSDMYCTPEIFTHISWAMSYLINCTEKDMNNISLINWLRVFLIEDSWAYISNKFPQEKLRAIVEHAPSFLQDNDLNFYSFEAIKHINDTKFLEEYAQENKKNVRGTAALDRINALSNSLKFIVEG